LAGGGKDRRCLFLRGVANMLMTPVPSPLSVAIQKAEEIGAVTITILMRSGYDQVGHFTVKIPDLKIAYIKILLKLPLFMIQYSQRS